MKEELKKVLEMVKDGKISIDDACRIIEVMKSGEEKQDYASNIKEKRLVRVYVAKDGKQAVNLTIPFSFLDLMLKVGAKGKRTITIEGEEIPIDIESIRNALKDPNFSGKIVDIDVPEENTKVLIEIV